MASVGLSEFGQVTLDGSGNGVASVGPISSREVWNIAQVTISVSTVNRQPQCNVYQGDGIRQSTLRDTTFLGGGNSTGHVQGKMRVGEQVFAVFTGGDPGAVAVVNVYGTKEV